MPCERGHTVRVQVHDPGPSHQAPARLQGRPSKGSSWCSKVASTLAMTTHPLCSPRGCVVLRPAAPGPQAPPAPPTSAPAPELDAGHAAHPFVLFCCRSCTRCWDPSQKLACAALGTAQQGTRVPTHVCPCTSPCRSPPPQA